MVKGLTREERAAARAVKKQRDRRRYFADEAKKARNGREKVQHVCRFVLAVSERELDDAGRAELARRIAVVVMETSPVGGDGL